MVRVASDPVVRKVEVVVAGTTRQEHALLRSLVAIVLTSSSQLLYRHSGEVHSGSGAGQASISSSSSSTTTSLWTRLAVVVTVWKLNRR